MTPDDRAAAGLVHAVAVLVRRPPPAERDAGGRIRSDGPELLAVRRPADDLDLPDAWGLPAATPRAGESWWEAVRRAGRDKLGVELGGLRLLREGRAQRPGRTLHMRLFGAGIEAGTPSAPQAVDGVTQYAEWAWAAPSRLEEAAGRGSLCSRLCMAWLAEASGDAGSGGVGPSVRDGGAGEDDPLAGVAEPDRVEGVVVRGHRAASGDATDPFLPGGTIRAQLPAFRARGLDLSAFHPATLNVSVAPEGLVWGRPRATFRDLEWRPGLPRETFSFSPCRLLADGSRHPGWLYRPHPETKPRHEQPPGVVEVLTRHLAGVGYGSRVGLEVDPSEVRVRSGRPPPR